MRLPFNIKKGSNCSLVVSVTEQHFRMPKMIAEKKEKKAEKRKKLKQHVAQKDELEVETKPKKKKQKLQVWLFNSIQYGFVVAVDAVLNTSAVLDSVAAIPWMQYAWSDS